MRMARPTTGTRASKLALLNSPRPNNMPSTALRFQFFKGCRIVEEGSDLPQDQRRDGDGGIVVVYHC